jgi:hypothetical protein
MPAEPMNQVSARLTRVQQAVGKHVSALLVRGQLYFVDRDEIDLARERHGFGRADPEIGPPRYALFFTRDQRHAIFTDASADAVVHLARQQPERQADHSALVLEHALDRAVRFARVGRTEQRDALSGIRKRHPTSMPCATSSSQQERSDFGRPLPGAQRNAPPARSGSLHPQDRDVLGGCEQAPEVLRIGREQHGRHMAVGGLCGDERVDPVVSASPKSQRASQARLAFVSGSHFDGAQYAIHFCIAPGVAGRAFAENCCRSDDFARVGCQPSQPCTSVLGPAQERREASAVEHASRERS